MTPFQFYANTVFNGLVEGCIIAMLALALTLTYAVSRFHNAATGDYMTVGAYVAKAAGFAGGMSAVTGGIAGALACAAIALFFYLWIFRELARRSHVSAAIGSVGVALLLRSVVALAFGTDTGQYDLPLTRAIRFAGLFVQPSDLWLMGTAALVLAAVFALLHLTPMGRRLRAIADSRDLARTSGIRSGPALLTMWVVVGAVAATGGILLGIKSVLYPSLGWNLLMPGFTAAIFGGLGNPLGAVLGGLAIGLAQEGSALVVGESYKVAVCFVILALVLLWRPQGLLGRVEEVR